MNKHGRTDARRFLTLSLLAFMLTACLNDDQDVPADAAIVKVGDAMPAFTLHGSDGSDVRSVDVSGKVYVLNFFDTTCPDCQQELQTLQHLYDKYRLTVPILTVPRSQTKDEVADYWKAKGLTMPFYMASDSRLYYQFASSTIPRTYVVDGNGRVCAAFDDAPVADFSTLDAALRQLLNDAALGEGTVDVTVMARMTRAPGTAEEHHFENEFAVSSLDLWFFDAQTKKFFTKATVKNLLKMDKESNAAYDITYVFEDINIKAGLYDIFAVANYSDGLDEVDDELELLNLVDSITYHDGIAANIPDEGPVMTSSPTALLAVDLVPWIDKNYVLTVDMERVMAKLQIGVSQNTFELSNNGVTYAGINITNYKFVNLNTQYYLFQHRDSLPQFSQQPTFEMPYHFLKYKDEGEQYVVDPLFYLKSPGAINAAVMKKYYRSWYGEFTTSDFASMPSAGNYGYAYILENTVYKSSQKNGYTPGIVFKAAVSPAFVYLYDAKTGTLEQEQRPEYWPATVYFYNYNFYGSLQAINKVASLALDELQTYTDAQLKAYGIKQCRFNMGVYETFYTYWIQHRKNADPLGAMTYGILRNHFYKMTVAGISGIGNSTITPDIMRDNYPNSYADVVIRGEHL